MWNRLTDVCAALLLLCPPFPAFVHNFNFSRQNHQNRTETDFRTNEAPWWK